MIFLYYDCCVIMMGMLKFTKLIASILQVDSVFHEPSSLVMQNQNSTTATALYLYRISQRNKFEIITISLCCEFFQKGDRAELHQLTEI